MAPTPRTAVAGYLRVSTDRQAEHGHGLAVQRKAITRWASANGFRVTCFLSDEGISGSNGLDTRVALADALDLVRQRKVSGVVVYRLDRLSRDMVLQEMLIQDVARMGGRIYSTSDTESNLLGSDVESDPTRTLVRRIIGALSSYEREVIAMRTQAGRRRKADMGGYAYGAPPFGMRAEGGDLVVDAVEQAAIARVVELHMAGASIRAIAATLNEEGIRTKQDKRWHPTTVARLIERAAA
jgi:DNA invertase Pin-like site-specific DNA recombinase